VRVVLHSGEVCVSRRFLLLIWTFLVSRAFCHFFSDQWSTSLLENRFGQVLSCCLGENSAEYAGVRRAFFLARVQAGLKDRPCPCKTVRHCRGNIAVPVSFDNRFQSCSETGLVGDIREDMDREASEEKKESCPESIDFAFRSVRDVIVSSEHARGDLWCTIMHECSCIRNILFVLMASKLKIEQSHHPLWAADEMRGLHVAV